MAEIQSWFQRCNNLLQMHVFHLKGKNQPLADGFFFQIIFKIVVLKIGFAETAVLEPLSNKVVGLDTWNFIKNRFHHRCFPLKFVKFFRTSFLTEHLQQLLLKGKIISPNYLFFSQHSYSLMNFVEILFSNKFFIHKNYVQNIHCLALVRHD